MAMEYQQLTQDERDEMLAEALYGREREHFAYETEIQHHQQLLAQLPTKAWPKRLEHLRGLGRDQMIMAAKDATELDEAAQYADRDRIAGMLAASTLERGRVEKYHAATLAQLPAARRAAAFSRAATKRAEREAAQRATGRGA